MRRDTTLSIIMAAVVLSLVLLLAWTLTLHPVAGAIKTIKGPLYTSGDGHYIVFHLKFTNACWEQVYMRATPKGANHVALNSLTIQNTKPSNERQPDLTYKLPFDGKKVEKYAAEKRTRAYVTAELPGEHYKTVTIYKPYDRSTKYYHFHFLIVTEPMYCAPTAGR